MRGEVLICEIAAVVATGVGAALPERTQITGHDELLHIPSRPADRQAPENRVNLIDELAHIYTRMRLASNETDVQVVGTTMLGITEKLPSELACARG